MRRSIARLGLVAALAWPGVASAELVGPVLVVPFEHGPEDEGLSFGFRRLLEVQVSAAVPVVSGAGTPCGNLECARGPARAVGAGTVVFGSLVRLGRKIRVVAVAAEVETGRTLAMTDLAVGQVEELDLAAERIAPALYGATEDARDGAVLGAITREEARADVRREGERGLGLRLGGLFPVGDAYSGSDVGLAVDLVYGFETRSFLVEPRIGLRWSVDPSGARTFWEVPIDIGGYYIFGLGDLAPFIGGGMGLRYLYDERDRTVVTGQVIQTVSTQRNTDDAWAFGGFLRAGLMLLRTYEVRLSFTVEYDLALTTLNGVENPQAVVAGVGVHF